MHGNKYSIRRLKHLLAMLRENRYPNYPRFLAELKKFDLAGAGKLSARTLQRDVAFLKSEYAAPIAYDTAERGYYLTNPYWSCDIPLLEEGEMQAAVLGARLAENLMPPPVKQEVRQAVDWLLAANDDGLNEKAALLALVAAGSRAAVAPEIFRNIFDCWQKHRTLRITYGGLSGGESCYLMEPHVLAFYEGNWYSKGIVIAKNGRMADAQRTSVFALHRILAAEPTERPFDLDRELVEEANRRELLDFPLEKEVRLELSDEAYKFIGEEFDFRDDGMQGARHIVTIKSAPRYRIVNYVIVEGGEAKLLSHPEIRAEVIRRAQMCIQKQREKRIKGKQSKAENKD